jgi:hypothetical protein
LAAFGPDSRPEARDFMAQANAAWAGENRGKSMAKMIISILPLIRSPIQTMAGRGARGTGTRLFAVNIAARGGWIAINEPVAQEVGQEFTEKLDRSAFSLGAEG